MQYQQVRRTTEDIVNSTEISNSRGSDRCLRFGEHQIRFLSLGFGKLLWSREVSVSHAGVLFKRCLWSALTSYLWSSNIQWAFALQAPRTDATGTR